MFEQYLALLATIHGLLLQGSSVTVCCARSAAWAPGGVVPQVEFVHRPETLSTLLMSLIYGNSAWSLVFVLVDRFEKFTTEMCPSMEHNWLSAGEWLATLPRLQSRTHVLLLNLSSIEADILTVSE